MNGSWHIEQSIHRVPNSSQMLFFIFKKMIFFSFSEQTLLLQPARMDM